MQKEVERFKTQEIIQYPKKCPNKKWVWLVYNSITLTP